MNKKSLIVFASAVVLVGAGFGLHLLTTKAPENKEAHAALSQFKIVNVDVIVREPEKFTGTIGVEGLVTKSDETGSTFALGCEDACILMPVKFAGQRPKEGTNVIVYGEIKKTEGAKYIFVAQEIATK